MRVCCFEAGRARGAQDADDLWRNAQTAEAKKELNLLASLIGPAPKPTENFKINLFPEANNARCAPRPPSPPPENLDDPYGVAPPHRTDRNRTTLYFT